MGIVRGNIILADLGVAENCSIQRGIRPYVVISNNKANRYSQVITVVPLTTKIAKKRHLPTHVFVSAYRSEGLRTHSIALCEQVTAADYSRIIEVIGHIDDDTMEQITKGVQVQVGVYEDYN
jgi:mRNA interferase MazF